MTHVTVFWNIRRTTIYNIPLLTAQDASAAKYEK